MSISTRLHLIVALLSALWCAGILGAPLLKHAGENELAGIGYSLFSKVCHQSDARSFHLEGEELGVCVRCTAVYSGFLIGVIILLLLRVPGTQKAYRQAFIVSVAPMLLDIFLNDCGIRASTTVSRLVTGGLFGAAMPWFILPLLVEACTQILDRHRFHQPPSGVHHYVRKAW